MTLSTATPDLREIVARRGGDLFNGGRAALIPGPGHSRQDRSLSLRLTPDGGRVLWFSHAGDQARDVWSHLGLERSQVREETPAEKRQRQAAERAERERKLAWCGDLWRGTAEAAGSPVERYLRGRGLTLPIPAALRFHPAAPLRYPWNETPGETARTLPAMVAIATAEDGKSAAGLHVTYLAPDGAGKAKLKNARHMFGDLGGAVVQLSPVPQGAELGVAEGIETALAYRQLTGTPTWAALSTSGLRRFTAPPGPSRLVIAADSDDAGIEAARVCAARATRRCECLIMPAPEGQDWADALKGGG